MPPRGREDEGPQGEDETGEAVPGDLDLVCQPRDGRPVPSAVRCTARRQGPGHGPVDRAPRPRPSRQRLPRAPGRRCRRTRSGRQGRRPVPRTSAFAPAKSTAGPRTGSPARTPSSTEPGRRRSPPGQALPGTAASDHSASRTSHAFVVGEGADAPRGSEARAAPRPRRPGWPLSFGACVDCGRPAAVTTPSLLVRGRVRLVSLPRRRCRRRSSVLGRCGGPVPGRPTVAVGRRRRHSPAPARHPGRPGGPRADGHERSPCSPGRRSARSPRGPWPCQTGRGVAVASSRPASRGPRRAPRPWCRPGRGAIPAAGW
ncbi:hypothetical protein SVIOM342S_09823 [Streptomyces violaceorubidus]